MSDEINAAADEANARWPEVPKRIPVPAALAFDVPHVPTRAWRSSAFLIQEYVDNTGGGKSFVRLSVQRVEHASFRTDQVENPISWDELMTVKNQVGYSDRWAVEVYPPDAEVVNRARMRHLFLVGRERIPFAWSAGRSGRSGLAAERLIEASR